MLNRKSLAVLGCCTLALALVASPGRAETAELPKVATLEPDTLQRGDTVRVSILNGPDKVQEAQIRLERSGTVADLPALYQPGENGRPALVTALRPLSEEPPIDLGGYRVSARLDKRPFPASKLLTVVPLGNPDLQLKELAPATVEQTQRAFFVDETDEKALTEGSEVVSFALHGLGFETRRPDDNLILIDNLPQKVSWATCKQLEYGSATARVPRKIVAEVVNEGEIHLCRVPVPLQGEMLVAVGRGDRVSDRCTFRVLSMGRRGVASCAAIISVLLALLPLALLGFLTRSREIGQSKYRLRLLFLDAETDTYSLSKLQFYLWTFVALFGYAYLFISRVQVQHASWPDVPNTLPGVIGIAAGTSIGSQFITSAKGSKGAGAEQPSFADFIISGGVVAPDRVQMLLWTLAGVGAFFVMVLQQHPGVISSLPPVPEGLLYLSGLSSAGYLGGKLARKPGPVINEISLTPSEPNDSLAEAALSSANELPDLTLAVIKARTELARLPSATTANEPTTRLGRAIAAASAAHTVAELNQLVADLSEWAAAAEKQAEDAAAAYAAVKDEAKTAAAAEAAVAQGVAGIIQELAADVTQAISVATAAPMQATLLPPRIARTITLRGTNLSSEGMFEIDGDDLPFRMLLNSAGKHEPDVIVRDPEAPTFARVLRLTIDPEQLEATDLATFSKWFGSSGTHTFTLTNPDGQKAELKFALPPGETQKASTAT